MTPQLAQEISANPQQWLDLSKEGVVDYFPQFTEGTEALNIFDVAVASVAVPLTAKKTMDTFAEK